jgi:hypothetical protein
MPRINAKLWSYHFEFEELKAKEFEFEKLKAKDFGFEELLTQDFGLKSSVRALVSQFRIRRAQGLVQLPPCFLTGPIVTGKRLLRGPRPGPGSVPISRQGLAHPPTPVHTCTSTSTCTSSNTSTITCIYKHQIRQAYRQQAGRQQAGRQTGRQPASRQR